PPASKQNKSSVPEPERRPRNKTDRRPHAGQRSASAGSGAFERVLFHREGQQRDGAGALDGFGKLALMLGAVAGHAAGQNLAAFVGEAANAAHVFVINKLDFIHAEAAHLAAGLTAARTAYSLVATIF